MMMVLAILKTFSLIDMRVSIDLDEKSRKTLLKTLLKGIFLCRRLPSKVRKTRRGYHIVWSGMDIDEKTMYEYRRRIGDDSVSSDTPIYWRKNGDLMFTKISELHESFRDGNHIEVLTLKPIKKKCRNKKLRDTLTIKKCNIAWAVVINSWKKGIRDVYRVETNDGSYVDVTKCHSIMCLAKKSKRIEEVELKDVFDRKIITAIKCIHDGTDKYNFGLFRGSGFITLLGLWLADGFFEYYYYKGKKKYERAVTISTGGDERIISFLRRFSKKCGLKLCKKGNKGDYRIHSTYLSGFMRGLGFNGNSFTKKIPEDIFTLKNEYIESFLRGYFSGDGSLFVDKGRPVICADTSSPHLAYGMRILLSKVGIKSTVYSHYSRKGFGTSDKNFYKRYRIKIEWRKSVKKFLDEIGFIKRYDKNHYVVKENRNTHRKQCDVSARAIRDIRYVGRKEVYDLELHPTHTFLVANGILCHNSNRIRLDQISEKRLKQVLFKKKKIYNYEYDAFGNFKRKMRTV